MRMRELRDTLTPAYGRDYKSKAEITAALNKSEDFMLQPSMQYSSGPELKAMGYTQVRVRYARLRKITVVKL